MKRLYFAYGANMNPENMSWRCPAAVNPEPFKLQDWQLKFYTHATVEPVEGSETHGILWELTPACEHTLDVFEGFPHYYTKREHEQNGIKFFFYEMASNQQGFPYPSYIDDIEDVYLQYNMPIEHLTRALNGQLSYN